MEERPLGGSGIVVPVVGMGTWKTFDVEGAERNARRRLVREAIDAGIRLFDTSPMYGAAPEVLADSLMNARDEAIVADKVWASTADEGKRQIASSLERYGGEVEIFQVHNLRAWQIHLKALEAAKQRDEVRAIGITHYNHAAFDEVADVMQTGRIDVVQLPYNLIDRAVEKKLLPLAEKLGIGVLVMEPFGTGALMRKRPSEDALTPWRDAGIGSWAELCLRWILSDPRVSAILPATSSSAHMLENAAAGRGRWLDEAERADVSALVT